MSGGEMSGGGRMGSGSMSTVPFASLETLCVTDNRIEVAADVLNAALITSLRSLLLWGNPIARKTAVLPIEVRALLIDGCGIAVESKEPKKSVRAPLLPDPESFVRVTKTVSKMFCFC